jgi:hypothetical protein
MVQVTCHAPRTVVSMISFALKELSAVSSEASQARSAKTTTRRNSALALLRQASDLGRWMVFGEFRHFPFVH